MNYLWLQLAAFCGTFLYSSLFEWTLHRFFMHQVTFGIVYPFRAHAQVHHQVFKSDYTYHLQPGVNPKLITFAKWNYPFLLALNSPIIVALEMSGLRVTLGIVLGMSSYYFLYEYLHYAMHRPTGRFFESWKVFKFIDHHHLIHHKYMHRNLNVVLPLVDTVLGTLMLKTKVPIEAGEPMLAPDEVNPDKGISGLVSASD